MMVALPRCWTSVISSLGLFGLATTAHAAPPTAAESGASPDDQRLQCVDAHRHAQELRQQSKLVEARKELLACSSGTCPDALISDCITWLEAVEQSTPSLVFEVNRDGRDAPDARLFVDGVEVLDPSSAFRANPGRHTVRVELPPFPPKEEEVVLREGQRMRLLTVKFETPPKASAPVPAPAAPSAPPRREITRPTPFAVYPLLALGAAGLGGFGALAYLGRDKERKLEDACAPRCTDSDVAPAKQLYLAGDISLAVGGAALVTALSVYLLRPSTESASATLTGVGLSIPESSLPGSRPWGVAATGTF